MPEIFRIFGMRFFFYSRENDLFQRVRAEQARLFCRAKNSVHKQADSSACEELRRQSQIRHHERRYCTCKERRHQDKGHQGSRNGAGGKQGTIH